MAPAYSRYADQYALSEAGPEVRAVGSGRKGTATAVWKDSYQWKPNLNYWPDKEIFLKGIRLELDVNLVLPCSQLILSSTSN